MSVDDLLYYSRHQPVRLRQQFYFLSLYIGRDSTSYVSFIATLLKFNVQSTGNLFRVQILIQSIWGGAQASAFLTSSQGKLILRICKPHQVARL